MCSPSASRRCTDESRYAWDSATVIGLFCGFVGNFIVWALWNNWKGDKALIPFSMVSKLVVWTSCLFLGILFGSMFGESGLYLYMPPRTYLSNTSSHSRHILPPNLLPSRRWREPNNERRLHAPQHPRTALLSRPSRATRRQNRPIPALRSRQRSTHVNRLRAVLDLQPQHHDRRMDRLPDPLRRRPRHGIPDAHRRGPAHATTGAGAACNLARHVHGYDLRRAIPQLQRHDLHPIPATVDPAARSPRRRRGNNPSRSHGFQENPRSRRDRRHSGRVFQEH